MSPHALSRHYVMLAALSGFAVVALGAFGAHALEARLSADRLQTWQTAVQYQMFHTTALLAVAWLARTQPASALLRWSGRLFTAGLLLFCGSLYLLALSGARLLGAITPLGGVAWLAAWLLLAKVALAQTAD